MSDQQVVDILLGAFTVASKVAGPILLAGLVLGVVISLFQTITQVQEMTLTFVPKLAATAAIIVFGGNWIMREVITWVETLWGMIPTLG